MTQFDSTLSVYAARFNYWVCFTGLLVWGVFLKQEEIYLSTCLAGLGGPGPRGLEFWW